MNKRCPNIQQVLLCDCTEGKCQVKKDQKKLLTEIMEADEKDGLYKQQTAVEWLLQQMENKNGKEFSSYYVEFIEQAKAMEKEQIKNAFSRYQDDEDAEDYYNETYNK